MSSKTDNLSRCFRFERCSHNICPLDPQLFARVGFDDSDKCPFMRPARATAINGKQFTTGGSVMPDAELILVPRDNVERLNDASQKRWRELNHSP